MSPKLVGGHSWRQKCVILKTGYFEKTLKRYIDEALRRYNPDLFRAPVPVAASASASENTDPKMFEWPDGSCHPLPLDYVLTCRGDATKAGEELKQARTPFQAYMCWHLPDLKNGICAIYNCSASDFSLRNQRKRFSDWGRFIRIWHGCILMDRQKLMDAGHAGTEKQFEYQFHKGFDVYVTWCKFLHPSRRKRQRIRKNPSIALSYKVSTVLTDMYKLRRVMKTLKLLFKLYRVQGFIRRKVLSTP